MYLDVRDRLHTVKKVELEQLRNKWNKPIDREFHSLRIDTTNEEAIDLVKLILKLRFDIIELAVNQRVPLLALSQCF